MFPPLDSGNGKRCTTTLAVSSKSKKKIQLSGTVLGSGNNSRFVSFDINNFVAESKEAQSTAQDTIVSLDDLNRLGAEGGITNVITRIVMATMESSTNKQAPGMDAMLNNSSDEDMVYVSDEGESSSDEDGSIPELQKTTSPPQGPSTETQKVPAIEQPSSHIIIVVIPVLECLHMKCYMGGNVVLLGVEEKLDNENWQIKRCDTFLKTREVKSRFIEPFRIIARIGNVAYRLELPEEIEWKVNQLRNKSLNQVKVQWNNIRGFDAMWGSEDEMKNSILFF
ncbi:hypothetical protein E3N88_26275 [Mikania micrantha]|uniref:Tf2-1-like SH3-like domain-containing protein n=1 Tax=Mikania micrantha TaxID=192012 RepID=A0A5N6N8J8_9ASTR|nr:hypothetical protein E3N88_26275 [Mikania micrantha]